MTFVGQCSLFDCTNSGEIAISSSIETSILIVFSPSGMPLSSSDSQRENGQKLTNSSALK